MTSSSEEAVIDVSGVGYRLFISVETYRRLPPPGSQVLLLTHYQVREDAHQLFGFLDEAELQLFRLLLSISGVGPKLAIAVLSGLDAATIRDAIISNRPETLYGISGVGKKTAARIILELRDKILKSQPPPSSGSVAPRGGLHAAEDAVAALMTLGFARNMAQKAVSGILDGSAGLSVEEIVRSALSAIRSNT